MSAFDAKWYCFMKFPVAMLARINMKAAITDNSGSLQLQSTVIYANIAVVVGDVNAVVDQRVSLEMVVADYDRIGSSDPIGRVELGYNRKGKSYMVQT